MGHSKPALAAPKNPLEGQSPRVRFYISSAEANAKAPWKVHLSALGNRKQNASHSGCVLW